jgi:cyclophilin family peptidyl-prolyl cis-trans isomerase
LPFLALTLVAAKDPPPPAPKPPVSLVAPAEIAADPANKWTLELSNGGKVVVQLRPDIAPQHVYRIQQLTTQGFYNGLSFHRVIAGFMAQGGDPKGTGEGGSPLPDLPAEFNDLPHVRGVASMARAEAPGSANSQFFIILSPTMKLDHKYSAFGRVTEGMAAVDGIAVGEPPAQPTTIVRASIGGPLPAPPVAAAAVAATPAPAAAEQAVAAPAPADEAPAPAQDPVPAPAEQAVAAPAPAAEGPATASEAPAAVETAAPAPTEQAAAAPAAEVPPQEAPPPNPQ